MRDVRLARIGGVCALAWVAIQVVGNLLHPTLPEDSVAAMTKIAATAVWVPAHVILIADYFLLVPLMLGINAGFARPSATTRLGLPLALVAVAIGVGQVVTHPTLLGSLAHDYVHAGDAATRQFVQLTYEAVWGYNVVLEVGHLLLIYLAIALFSIAMLEDSLYPRWIGWLGIVGAVVAGTAVVIGEVVFKSSVLADKITFGAGLAPLAVWLLAVGTVLLRAKPEAAA